jgi:hypothetical protein
MLAFIRLANVLLAYKLASVRSDQAQATNIFGRVFSYTPRSESRTPLEDFCTESLAWCIIHSLEFRKLLLDRINIKLSSNARPTLDLSDECSSVRVDTQFPFHGEEDEETEVARAARFDLLLRSSADNAFAMVIEVKVNLDGGLEEQLDYYRSVVTKGKIWTEYNERYVMSLTPSTQSPKNSDAHLSWDEVQSIINGMKERNLVHSQFSEFLQLRHLGNIKLMKTTPHLSESFEQTAQYFAGYNSIFERFIDQENLKTLFGPRNVKVPLLEYYPDEANRWFAKLSFYSVSNEAGGLPFYYAGVFTKDKKFWLYMQTDQGGKISALGMKSVDPDVIKAVGDMKGLFGESVFYWPDANSTSILFCKELTNEMGSNEILQWYETIAREICRISA